MPANSFNDRVFTTSYSYGLNGKEYVFSCKGRPFAALVSPHLPTPTSSLLDYDLVKKLGLPLVDIQCRKFYFGGHRMRILGRVSTAVQCVKDGRINGNFHIKGLVISDLYQMMDTHCVAGARMQEKLAHLTDIAGSEESDEELYNDIDGSSTTAAVKSSPSTTAAVKSSSSTTAAVKSSSNASASSSSQPFSPVRSPITAAMVSPVMSPTTRESQRIRTLRLEKDREEREDSIELWKNERAWAKLKRQHPEVAWTHLKYVAGVQDWPDWDPDLCDLPEPSLDDEPMEFMGKWLQILEETDPDCLCICGFPHNDYKCRVSKHKKKKHCKDCCDDPKSPFSM